MMANQTQKHITLLAMLVMKAFTSRLVGQLFWQGASAHFRHLSVNKRNKAHVLQLVSPLYIWIALLSSVKCLVYSEHEECARSALEHVGLRLACSHHLMSWVALCFNMSSYCLKEKKKRDNGVFATLTSWTTISISRGIILQWIHCSSKSSYWWQWQTSSEW